MKNEVKESIEKVKHLKVKTFGILLTVLVIAAVISTNVDTESILYVIMNVFLIIMIVMLFITSIIYSTILSKLKMTETTLSVVSIFNDAVEEKDEYIFPITDEETNVTMHEDGFEINGISCRYEDYEISLYATAYRHVFDLSVEMLKKGIEDEERDIEFHEAFEIKLTPELYRAMIQFEIELDADSKKRLALLKNDPEESIKRMMRRGFLKINEE